MHRARAAVARQAGDRLVHPLPCFGAGTRRGYGEHCQSGQAVGGLDADRRNLLQDRAAGFREGLLDPLRADPLSGDLEHVVAAPGEHVAAVRPHQKQVAGAEPAGLEAIRLGRRAAPVAERDGAVPELQPTRRFGVGGAVPHAHLGHRRSRQRPVGLVGVEHQAEGFRSPVAADRRAAGGRAPVLAHGRRQGFAGRDEVADSQCRQLVGDAPLQHLVVQGRHAEQQRRAVPARHFGDALGSRPLAVQDHRRAGPQAGEQAVSKGIGEEQLGRGIEPILRAKPENADGERMGMGHAAVRMDHALG